MGADGRPEISELGKLGIGECGEVIVRGAETLTLRLALVV